jgi:leucyl aminopeptidase
MQISVKTQAPEAAKVDLLAIPAFKIDPSKKRLPSNLVALDKKFGGPISAAIDRGDFRGISGQVLTVYPNSAPGAKVTASAKRILLVGLGDPNKLSAEALRELGGRCSKQANLKRATTVGLYVPAAIPAVKGIDLESACRAIAEGATLGGYRFDAYLSEKKDAKKPSIRRFALHFTKLAKPSAARAAVAAGSILGESQNLARDLSNEPGNALPPIALARAAVKMSREVGLKSHVMEVPELKRRKMGAILAVGQGSVNPPRLVVMEHNPAAATRAKGKTKPPTICLIGKGITFDSGGISIKPSANMHEMKHDMSGAAAVVGAMRAIKLLNIPHRVVGIIAAAENMPAASAYRPGDIITTHLGKTVEILNTDAEGRLVLADALSYANEAYSPVAMIDLATLTGACMVALGDWATGLLGTNQTLINRVKEAGDRSGECAWPLPLFDGHIKAMQGSISDLVNAGARQAGTSTAAGFLAAFVGDTPWVHLDIAGTGWTSRTGPYQGRGATGVGVRMLVEMLLDWKPMPAKK